MSTQKGYLKHIMNGHLNKSKKSAFVEHTSTLLALQTEASLISFEVERGKRIPVNLRPM